MIGVGEKSEGGKRWNYVCVCVWGGIMCRKTWRPKKVKYKWLCECRGERGGREGGIHTIFCSHLKPNQTKPNQTNTQQKHRKRDACSPWKIRHTSHSTVCFNKEQSTRERSIWLACITDLFFVLNALQSHRKLRPPNTEIQHLKMRNCTKCLHTNDIS